MLKSNRSALVCILLIIITFGIYGLYMIHQMAKDANTADQSSKIGGLLAYILLSFITFGIYSLYWNYKVCEKFGNSVRASGQNPKFTGGSWLLWYIVGSLIIVGPLVAYVKQIHLWNDSNNAFNMRMSAGYGQYQQPYQQPYQR